MHDEHDARIRIATAEDAEVLAAIYAPYVVGSAISFEVTPPSPGEMRARLATCLERFPWLALEASGAVLGFAYASKHRDRASYRWSIDTSVYVREEGRGRGVGRALYTSLLALVELQGFFVAHAGITLPNAASVRLHESFGFAPVGVYRDVGFKLGRWHDVGWWRKPLRDPSSTPSEPVAFGGLEATARQDAIEAGIARRAST